VGLLQAQALAKWRDCRRGGDGARYVLVAVPLDEAFFKAALGQYDALVRQQADKILKKPAYEALAQLVAELELVRGAPFAFLAPAAPPAEGEGH